MIDPSPRLEKNAPSPKEGQPTGLRRGNFRQLAGAGFGDPRNSYAHCMNWFRGRLYVGTTRNIFQLVSIAPDQSTDAFHLWPVPVPRGLDATGLEQNCQIWRSSPLGGPFEQVFESPRIESQDGRYKVWRDFGYRSMVVCRTETDDAEALYVSTMSSSKAPGALILRSADGERFEAVTDPGIGDSRVSSYRALVGFKGRLFAAPAGSGRMWASAFPGVVLECRDPRKKEWRPASLPGFGDSTSAGVFEMAVFDGHLYAGVANPYTGIQVWKTDASGNPPYRWTSVLSGGAGRGKLNQAVMSMFPFQGALYVGTGIRRGGYDREFETGPAAGELIRIFPDDRYELVMGQERKSDGIDLKPLSGLGPGFDNPFNGYIWCMAEYDGCLYVGTYDSSIFVWWIDPNRVPRGVHPRLRLLGAQRIVDREGGFDLWRTPDGVHWFEVSRDGFGNPYNYGVRTLHGRENGLYVGTANPFGPQVAVQTATGWTYADNPRGGCEVWMGRPDVEPEEDRPAHTISGGAVNVHYDRAMYEHPLLRSGEYYSFSHYSNYGYWEEDTPSQKEACDNLMERLLGFLPGRAGRILDVACGLGATSRYLGRLFGPENVTGINISDKQIATCYQTAPGSEFLVMDATQLDFEDESFDNILCVEAAFHFRTRARFLREALRVLKPGGRLVLSDMLFTQAAMEKSPVLHPKNFVAGPGAYRDVLEAAGFEDACVVDATEESFIRCNEHFIRYALGKFQDGEIDAAGFSPVMANRLALLLSLRYYVLAGARKPPGAKGRGRDGEPSAAAGTTGQLKAFEREAYRPSWLEEFMKRDEKKAVETRGRVRRSAKAHWLLASVTRRQSQLHRELALLLDKEAEAHEAMARWDKGAAGEGVRDAAAPRAVEGPDAAGTAPVGAHPSDLNAPAVAAGPDAPAGGPADRKAAGVARVEARAHRDLALRADARTLWHKTVTALLLRKGMPDGSRVHVSPPGAPGTGDEGD
jgi:SAM-dependent methyltransferase